MGYYVQMRGDFVIPKAKQEQALKRLHFVNDSGGYDHLKSGGSWSEGEKRAVWFAWMPESFDMMSLKDILEAMGFETEVLKGSGDIQCTFYDSKTGAEADLMATIADCVNPTTIEWHGEDGTIWFWIFNGARLMKAEAIVRPGASVPHRAMYLAGEGSERGWNYEDIVPREIDEDMANSSWA